MIDRLNAALDGRYRLERELGQGGMATVFLATDLRHDRKVALKVLKPELGAVVGGDRFLAEIRTTANLQHPHILPLFDSGEADGLIFYVMPYVEGESLEDRIGRERQLPVEDAVRIAVKVLGALDHAHQAGVVHRDVKPANILLAAGEPLVADFGIALAVSQAGGGRITETGLTLGTPHYMSPEQATGDQAVDPRSDLYAVACVLFEMLAGQPPFVAATAQAVLAKLLTEDAPDVREQRRSTPDHVADAVEQGLERLPADRFQTAREFATALETPGVRRGARRSGREASASPRGRMSRLAGVLGWGLAVVLAGAWMVRSDGDGTPPAPTLRFAIPVDGNAGIDFQSLPALSPDEKWAVFDTRGDDASGLVLHRLDTGVTERLEGTEGARWPFFSADGGRVGFFTEDAVRAVDLASGGVDLLTRDPLVGLFQQRGLWLDDGWIVLDHNEADDLWGLAPGARTPVRLTQGEPGVEYAITSTSARLPGGHALVTRFGGPEGGPESVEVVLLTPSIGGVVPLSGVEGTAVGVVWPDTLLVGGPDGLSLVEVDAEAGRARPVEQVPLSRLMGGLARAALGTHLLVGIELDVDGVQRLVRVDRQGEMTDLGLGQSNWEYPRVSPDGNRLLVTEYRGSSDGRQLVLDLRTGATTPLPGGGEHAWSHDGTHVYFNGGWRDGFPIVRHRADGTGAAEVVTSGMARPPWVTSASPDGRTLLFYSQSIQEVDLATGETRVLIDDDGIERNGMFSPDGRFIAYSAAAGGRESVYVKPYPELDRRWTISPGDGQLPMWSPDGRTLYYVDGSRMYAVALEPSADGDIRPEAPELLFDRPFFRNPQGDQSYDLAADGSLIMIDGLRRATPVVVVNWLSEARREP